MICIESFESLFFRQIQEKGLCIFTAYIAFSKNREGNAVIEAAKFLYFFITARFLASELISGEPENDKALVLVFHIKFL